MINIIKSYIKTKNKIIVAIVVIASIASLLALFLTSKYAPKLLRLGPQKLQVSCPVPKDYCDKGKVIIVNGKLASIGFTLPSGTPLSASLEGTAQLGVVQDGKTKEKHPIVWLYGKGKLEGYVATYNFYGTPLAVNTSSESQQNMKEKEFIGFMGYGNFPKEAPYNGVNFVFSLRRGDKITTPPLPLSAFEFK